jgi:outer membrane immunogenic protein
MKKVLLVTASLIALGAPALAADLAARPYTKAPPMVAAAYDWSGFYAGINGGWGSSRNSWTAVPPTTPFIGGEGSHDADGGTVGGQVGYRWQAGTFVFGLEAQGNWADFSGSNLSTLYPNVNTTSIDAFGLFTGQVGYAVNNVLLYVKGGAAVTSNTYRINSLVGAPIGVTGDDTRWGGTIGAGLEYAFAPNWSVGVEYNHLFMQDRTYNFTTPAGVGFGADRIRQDVDLVTARLNYRFGGPAVTRY